MILVGRRPDSELGGGGGWTVFTGREGCGSRFFFFFLAASFASLLSLLGIINDALIKIRGHALRF